MSRTLSGLLAAVGLLVITTPAVAKPSFSKSIGPAVVRALNASQHLKIYKDQYYSTDFRVRTSDLQRGRHLRRAPTYDRAGLKAFVFGVPVVTPHVKRIYSDHSSTTVATAVRRVVGVALIGPKGETILDASNLRVKRLDPPPPPPY